MLIGLGIAGFSFGLYVLSSSSVISFGHSDQSAQYVCQHLGLSPFSVSLNPIWGAFIRFVGHMTLSGLAGRLNIFSALCGAASVWLLYIILSSFVTLIVASDENNRPYAGAAGRLAGIVGSLSLAFSLPFWTVSNRAHPASFDTMLLLACSLLLLIYTQRRSILLAGVFALLYGVAVVEFSTMIGMLPFFVTVFVLFTLRHGLLNWKLAGAVIGSFLIGASLYLVVARWMYHQPSYEYGQFRGYLHVLRSMLYAQFYEVSHGLPREGWLIILFLTAIPWLTAFLLARRALNGEPQWGFYFLHIVFTGIVLIIAFNVGPAPWHLYGPIRPQVTAHLLVAWLAGYVAAYWYMLPLALPSMDADGAPSPLKRGASVAAAVVAILLVVVLPFRNFRKVDIRTSKYVADYVDGILSSLTDRSWLVTDGVLDNHIAIAAHARRQPLTLINPRYMEDPIYANYIASLFDEPRVKSMAHMGLHPFLHEWFTSDPDISKKVGVMANPDLWLLAGMVSVPYGPVFLGSENAADIDIQAVFDKNMGFWAEMVPTFTILRQKTGIAGNFAGYALFQLGRAANDLGVLMQDLNRPTDAYMIYSRAREIDPANASALLNLAGLIDSGFEAKDSAQIRKELSAIAADWERKPTLSALSRTYGYVFNPNAFGELGWVWALSGNRAMSIASLERATELEGPQPWRAKSFLADIYMEQDRDEASAEIYQEMLAQNPRNASILFRLCRLSARQGKMEEAKSYLARAAEAGANKSSIALESAVLQIMTGNLAEARRIIEATVADDPGLTTAWAMLSDVLILMDEIEPLDDCRIQLEKKPDPDFPISLALAQINHRLGSIDAARKYYEQALRQRPATMQVLERLLGIEIAEGNSQSVQTRLKQIFNIDANNPFANYVLGTIQAQNGEYELAENSLLRSIAVAKTPEALNSLAWTLRQLQKQPEAMRYALESLKLDRKAAPAWDTLGVILTDLGKYDNAEKCFDNARKLGGDIPEVILHQAELYEKMGKADHGLQLLESLRKDKTIILSSQNSIALKQLVRRLESH